MTDSAYCDLCDLPLAHCVHGMPPPPPPAEKPKPAPRTSAPRAPRKAATSSPSGSSSTSRMTVRRTGTTRTPQREFRQHILDALAANGGEDQMDAVLAEVERRMAPVLREGDHEPAERGEPRWRKAARFERKAMVDDGLLLPPRLPGLWTLSPEGRALAQG